MTDPSTPEINAVEGNYNPKLANADLVPAKKNWGWYNIFAFWMSDVHSVGGYVFAGTLFALGLQSWQVFVALILGIWIVMVLANLTAKPSQMTGVPYPVISRMPFGVYGANIPAMIRGVIAVVWYGIQTYLASEALAIILLKFFPSIASLQDSYFMGLSQLGWLSFMLMWGMQTALFLMQMKAIKVFIDWAGPAVYVVMFLLMVWIVYHAGLSNIKLTLSEKNLTSGQTILQFFVAVALIVAYFAGPTLNFGDFSRFCRTVKDVKRGNFWGLPINFTAFSVIAIVTISGTPAVFGHMIEDPLKTVGYIDNLGVALLLAFTFVTATIGINIVANFVSAANDISNLWPSKISWRTGGLIAAVVSVLITPWNLYKTPEIIHYTIDMLAAAIGPLYGIFLADFYMVRKQVIVLPDLFSDSPKGTYWYRNGVNPIALQSLVPAFVVSVLIAFVPSLSIFDEVSWMVNLRVLANFAFFIGMILAGIIYYYLSARKALAIHRG